MKETILRTRRRMVSHAFLPEVFYGTLAIGAKQQFAINRGDSNPLSCQVPSILSLTLFICVLTVVPRDETAAIATTAINTRSNVYSTKLAPSSSRTNRFQALIINRTLSKTATLQLKRKQDCSQYR